MQKYNRIREVLDEKGISNKWLSEQLDVNPASVSKWCTNSSQPRVEMLFRIARVLGVDVCELLVRGKEDDKLTKP
jgi:transcriptional regulator with XRE-family HTH domain